MEMSQGPLGVRTRARALALEKSSKNVSHSEGESAERAPSEPKQISYLELRSRRLEKIVGCFSPKEQASNLRGAKKATSERRLSDVTNSDVLDDCSSRLVRYEEVGHSLTMLDASKVSSRGRNNVDENSGFCFHLEKDAPQKVLLCRGPDRNQSRGRARVPGAAHSRTNSRSNSISREDPQGMLTRNQRKIEKRDRTQMEDMDVDAEAICIARDADNLGNGGGRNAEVEVSLGENPVDEGLYARSSNHGRLVRESTPCSYVREAGGPGSAMSLALGHDHGTRFLPPELLDPQALIELEIEEFFANVNCHEQRRFTERYNFDPVNDVPLPGRYEWIKLQPSL